MQDNCKNTSISFQNVPFFPTRQLLKSKHYCKTLRSTKKKNRFTTKWQNLTNGNRKKSMVRNSKDLSFVPNQIIAPKIS